MALSDLAGLAIGAGDRQARTVIAWHRTGFRMFWAWKSRRGRVGRPTVAADVRARIRRMHRENPLWGSPRIHGELHKLGIDVGETSVGKYIRGDGRRRPSQTWRTFLNNHVSTRCRSISSLSRRFAFRSSTCFSSSRTTGAEFFMPVSRLTPQPYGRRSNSARPFRGSTAPRNLLRDPDRIFGCDL